MVMCVERDEIEQIVDDKIKIVDVRMEGLISLMEEKHKNFSDKLTIVLEQNKQIFNQLEKIKENGGKRYVTCPQNSVIEKIERNQTKIIADIESRLKLVEGKEYERKGAQNRQATMFTIVISIFTVVNFLLIFYDKLFS